MVDDAVLERYLIGKQIGQGAYAVVRAAMEKEGQRRKVAMKIYKKTKLQEPNRRKSVRREVKLMERMHHNSITGLFEAAETSKYVLLMMEFVGGGSLHGYVKAQSSRRLPEGEAKRVFI